MLFTEQFNFVKKVGDSWFDPILDHDTKLFVDPFLIFQTNEEDFLNAHQKIVSFFNYIFTIIAQSGGDQDSVRYRKAINTLLFPETEETCLGYASSSTKGSGSSFGFSKIIAAAIWMSIKSGVKQINHFEELSVFNEGIGADRISDMTTNILKENFILYTQKICKKYNIPLQEQRVRNSSFDFENKIWHSDKLLLPINPFISRPIILVPAGFIRPLPIINPEDFWDYMCSHENQMLRDNFSYHIKGKVNKKEIIEIARSHLKILEKYVKFKETKKAEAYNLEKDPESYYRWYSLGKKVAKDNPLNVAPPQNVEEVMPTVINIVNNFRHYIELQKGYEILWVNHRPRSESVVQRIFMGIAAAYCKANDIDLSKEENLGSGAVDFKFSKGFNKKVLLETKLANNSKFWDGLTAQLPKYLESEQTKEGIYLVVAYRYNDLQRAKRISKLVSQINTDKNLNIKTAVIDARPKSSASQLSNHYKIKINYPKINLDDYNIDVNY